LRLDGRATAELVRDVLARAARVRLRVRGGSMWPFVREGDVVTLEALCSRPARVGEVVAAAHPQSGRLIVHRLVRKAGSERVLMGDRLAQPDEGLPAANLLGRVVAVERAGRQVRFGAGLAGALIALADRMAVLPGLWGRLGRLREGLRGRT
jgi:hypothetical protein